MKASVSGTMPFTEFSKRNVYERNQNYNKNQVC